MSGYDTWLKIWTESGASGEPGKVYFEIMRRYNEIHRGYHAITHLWNCYQELEAFWNQAPHRTIIGFALTYHDIVYDSEQADSELKSAEFSNEVMRNAGLDEAFRSKVIESILATGMDANSAIFTEYQNFTVDIDRSILGYSPKAFDLYERGIRAEYSFVSDEEFRTKRVNVLRGFLEKEYIFLTERFRYFYEARARENIARSLERLEND